MQEAEKRKVLIVDDDPTVIMILKRQVQNAGFEVLTASTGGEAVTMVRQNAPDLIVLDAVMPEMNGFEACREIRALDSEKKIPIIMLAGLKSDTDAMTAREAGATESVRKPVKGEELLRRILFYFPKPTRDS